MLLIPPGAFAIFLLHRRRERKTLVGSLYLWKRLSSARSSTRRRAKVRLSRSLVLQVLALMLACVALAEPRLTSGERLPHDVIVLDASYRMTSDGRPLEEVYERLISEALRAWDGTSPVSIVLAADAPTILLARSHSGRSLQRALGSLIPADSGPDWRATALVVRSLVTPAEWTRVYVVSPLAATTALDSMREVLGSAELSAVPVHLEGANIGFRRADVRPLEMGRTFTWEVQGQVLAQESGSVPVRMEFKRSGTTTWLPWQEVSIDLEAGVPEDFSANVTVPGAGTLRLVLPGDAIATDDEMYFVLNDQVRRIRILIVGTVDDALVRALATVPDVHIQRADELPASSGEFDLVVVDRVGLGRHPGTNTFWIGSSLTEGVAEEVAVPSRELSWSEHVLNAGVDWRSLELSTVRAVPRLDGAQVLLRAGDTPLIQIQRHGRGVDVTWAFPLSEGNAGRLAAPVIFLDNLLRLLVPNVGGFAGLQCSVGTDCFLPPAIVGPSSPLVVAADGRAGQGAGTRSQPPGPDGVLEIEPVPTLPRFVPTRAGIFAVGDEGALLAVNAIPREFVEVPQQAAAGAQLAIELGVSSRRFLLLIAALVVLVEAAMAARMDLVTDLRRNVPTRHLRRYLGPAALSVAVLGALMAAYWSRSEGAEARAIFLFDALAFSEGPWQPDGARSVLLSDYASSIAEGSISGGVVAVSADSGVVAGPWPVEPLEDAVPTYSSGADLIAGLRIANAMAGRDTRVLLATPGASTRGDLTALFQELHDAGFVVDTYGLDGMPPGEALVEAVRVPQSVRVGQEVEALLVAYSDVQQEARLRLSLDGEDIEDRVVDLRAGWSEVLTTFTAPASSSLLMAVLEPRTDVFDTNNSFGTVLNVRPRRPVLVVASDPGGTPAIAEALKSQGLEVETRTPELAPWTMDRWLAYEAVILVDVPADRLGVPRQEQLVSYVRDYGGGLAITGGYNSFGAGGYLGTALEEVAPVSSIFPSDAPEAALIFIVDRSGSMQQPVGTSNRLELAKQAVLEAIELLPDTNLVSVIAFDSEPAVLVPLQEAGDVASVLASLQRLFPSGGTAAFPALETALDMSSDLDLETIHVILLSDGLSQPADFAGLLDRFRETGITVSTVGIGQSANADQLRDIARWGGGVFHQSVELASLPSILSQEALLMSGSPIDEVSFRPLAVDREAGILDGYVGDFALAGMVLTTAKPNATVVLERDPEAPLLVGWQYGLGRVLAFTSDVLPVWSAELVASEDFPRLWSRALDWMSPVVPPPGVNAAVERYGDDLKLVVEVTSPSGEPVPGLTVRALVTTQSGEGELSLNLRQVRPGLYEGMVPAREPGRYGFEVFIDPTEDLEFDPYALEYNVSYPYRYTFSAFEESLAANIARASGGTTLDEAGLAEYVEMSAASLPRLETWRLLGSTALALWLGSLVWR